MPKILINEIDKTSAGTPGEYSNNTVLICGFSTKTNEEIIAEMEADPKLEYTLPDENGVFEFYSQNDFKKTIGKVSPILDRDEETHVPAHYGNQMAYELLGQGYQIIYYSLGKVPETDAEIIEKLKMISATDANTTNIWEIFKDKASYDFRFITHGLLAAHDAHDVAAAYNEAQTAQDDLAKAKLAMEAAIANNDALKTDPDYDATSAAAVAAAKVEEDAEKAHEDALKKYNKLARNYNALSEGCFTSADFDEANKAIADLAKWIQPDPGQEYDIVPGSGRGDCVALVEINETAYVNDTAARPEDKILTAAEKAASKMTSEYCACTVPSVVYKMTADAEYGGNMKFPGAFHYLVCYKRMIDANFAEWYAAAGYNRGVSNYPIDYTTVKLGEVAIQALEPRYKRTTPPTYSMPFAVNVIANFRGSYYLWGNRTCAELGSFDGSNDLTAKHFLNIRHLCTTIKKQLYVSCRRFTFDPNSDVLWINFKNSITPMLERMKADQGVRDFKIEKVYTDKKATLRAKIRIVPIEAVEDFVLELSLEDSLGETAVTVAEMA